MARWFWVTAVLAAMSAVVRAEEPGPLDVGVAGHAFDHLGDITDQAGAAAQSGATILYAGGFGSVGYSGLPEADRLAEAGRKFGAYVRDAKAGGIRIVLGYVCATSIVKIEKFDRCWTADFRARFSSPLAQWLQVDREGKALASWYGGDYRPACMNNPDWRAYEKCIVRLQIESGHDGIFFDNPTVHPQGCYCEHCMKRFETFLEEVGTIEKGAGRSPEEMRKLATERREDFLRFRGGIAPDFLREMRTYARTINPKALVTCNNSLNSPEAFFSQCRTYGYDIHSMSAAEDLVVVEDMGSQPRTLADGKVMEYGPVYEMLHAISHGKPVVATTLAEGDYHTPPNLMRLATAEAAAHGASYLSWSTWPEAHRKRMIEAVRPQANFLRQNAQWLNGTRPCVDVILFLPYGQWVRTGECKALSAARALGAANLQFRVVCEEDLDAALAGGPPMVVIESPAVLNDSERGVVNKFEARGGRVVWSERDGWMGEVSKGVRPPAVSVVSSHPQVRAVVREKAGRTIVHLLNLDVRRMSSFEDRVNPVAELRLNIRRIGNRVQSVQALSSDAESTCGEIAFKTLQEKGAMVVDVTVPRVSVSTILLIE